MRTQIHCLAFAWLVAMGCRSSGSDGGLPDTNTNWLKGCGSDDSCGGLSCICGVCTRECDVSRDCHPFSADAVCSNSCGSASVCLEPEEGCDAAMGTCPDAGGEISLDASVARDAGASLPADAGAESCAPPLPMTVCVDSPFLETGDAGVQRLEVAGTVTRVGTGYPNAGRCALLPSEGGTPGFGATTLGIGDESWAAWFAIGDDLGTETLISLTLPQFDVEFLYGRALSVQFFREPGSDSERQAYLDLSNAAAQPVLWMGEAEKAADLGAPLEMSLGPAECSGTDQCGFPWTKNALGVELPAASTCGGEARDALVSYGSASQLDGWVVANGAVDLPSSRASECADAPTALARAAAWPAHSVDCEVPLAQADFACSTFACSSTHAAAVDTAKSACLAGDPSGTQYFSGQTCGFKVVWVVAQTGNIYALFDRETDALVGWADYAHPDFCHGTRPRDESCFNLYDTSGEFVDVEPLCAIGGGADAGL